MKTPPDIESILSGLKDFQRATVDHVFDRMFSDGARRFLVADEVGLGKTMVARGLMAKIINRLWSSKKRIDVIYLCSNADIARQNVQRLSLPGCAVSAQSTRLTLLPLQQQLLGSQKVNFIALTPGTSFEQHSRTGRSEERVLLYWLLDQAWRFNGRRAPLYVLRGNAGADSFEKQVDRFDQSRINSKLATAFVRQINSSICRNLKKTFENLCSIYCRRDARPDEEARRMRLQWLGEVRHRLSRVCLKALKPDLIILDEFQRFRHLLDPENEAGELAGQLFDVDQELDTRVLLLSATPYRSLTLHHETEEDHYKDFIALVRFLENSDGNECVNILSEYREAIPAIGSPEGQSRLLHAKSELEERLRRIMTRTERLASSVGAAGMMRDVSAVGTGLVGQDVEAFLGAQRIADEVGQGDMVEYWKSAPYLLNFMDSYAFKQEFTNARARRSLAQVVRQNPATFLDFDLVDNYRPVPAANPKLRYLLEQTVERGAWRLLWMPPTLSYYRLRGAFDAPELAGFTKRLVFSSWHMVPRAVAAITSFEAERNMMRAANADSEVTQEDWRKQRGLLRFSYSNERLTGLPLMLLVYPCETLSRECDPRTLAGSGLISAEAVLDFMASRIEALIAALEIDQRTDGIPDERWYWLIPMLLDLRHSEDRIRQWWNQEGLAGLWAGVDLSVEDGHWHAHVSEARRLLFSVFETGEAEDGKLGPRPKDLLEVLALASTAAPATTAFRALTRLCPKDDETKPVRNQAARIGRSFLSLFNHAEATEMIRAGYSGEPYWKRVLEYSHDGGLQAVLDEYCHLLVESLGVLHSCPTKRVEEVSGAIVSALTLRAASLKVDRISCAADAKRVEIETRPMRVRFAMRFGDEKHDEESGQDRSGVTRKERVRTAFNSPFWPFVLVTTSVGQEGLDFHPYCHSVTHWNLPSNPIDLEQREGRVHRYKGHAVRKNLSAQFSPAALADASPDAWATLFELGARHRAADESDLVPFWVCPGEAVIERHVPALPFSRDVARLEELRRALTVYRMVFGQTCQEDLITFILRELPESERNELSIQLQLDLSAGKLT